MPPTDPAPYPNPEPPISPAYDPKRRVSRELMVMQPGEKVICEIKRHPIGIIGIYVGIGLLVTLLAVIMLGVAPTVLADSSTQIRQIGGVMVFGVMAVCLIYGLIATVVYWGNKWVVTSDSITQIEQTGLFTKQSSQLSMAALEDVTAEQNGLLTHIFNYGLLRVETAGHHGKFVFMYCPNPNFYAREILATHEAFEQHTEKIAESQKNPAIPQYPSPYPPGYDETQHNSRI